MYRVTELMRTDRVVGTCVDFPGAKRIGLPILRVSAAPVSSGLKAGELVVLTKVDHIDVPEEMDLLEGKTVVVEFRQVAAVLDEDLMETKRAVNGLIVTDLTDVPNTYWSAWAVKVIADSRGMYDQGDLLLINRGGSPGRKIRVIEHDAVLARLEEVPE